MFMTLVVKSKVKLKYISGAQMVKTSLSCSFHWILVTQRNNGRHFGCIAILNRWNEINYFPLFKAFLISANGLLNCRSSEWPRPSISVRQCSVEAKRSEGQTQKPWFNIFPLPPPPKYGDIDTDHKV